MYTLRYSSFFLERFEKLTLRNQRLKKRIVKALTLLQSDPGYPSLKSHRVNTREYGTRWSSWITGDLRVIWDYGEGDKLIILVLSLGGHSGKNKVY